MVTSSRTLLWLHGNRWPGWFVRWWLGLLWLFQVSECQGALGWGILGRMQRQISGFLSKKGPRGCGGLWDPDRWELSFSPVLLLPLPAARMSKLLHPMATPQLPNSRLLHSSPDGTLGLDSSISRGKNVSELKASPCIYTHVTIGRNEFHPASVLQALLCTQHQHGGFGVQREKQAFLLGKDHRMGVISWF